MTDLYEVEIEPEVRSWLGSRTDRDFGRVDFLVGLLAERAETLGEPYGHKERAKPPTASRMTSTNARENEMSTDHRSDEEIAHQRRNSADYREGHDEARRAFLIGQAVRERRLALGLSQTELAAGAGMTQPALSRLEAGGTVPTIPVLERIAVALDAELIVTIAPHVA